MLEAKVNIQVLKVDRCLILVRIASYGPQIDHIAWRKQTQPYNNNNNKKKINIITIININIDNDNNNNNNNNSNEDLDQLLITEPQYRF